MHTPSITVADTDACPHRVQVNIPNQFPQIGVFLAYFDLYRFLKEVPVAFVPPVETHLDIR